MDVGGISKDGRVTFEIGSGTMHQVVGILTPDDFRTPLFVSHTRPCGHFTGSTKTKNKQQRLEERNRQHGFRTAKLREVKSDTFKHFVCICYG